MEFYQLQYFEILCKYKSYTMAAQELNVTQPTISIAVRKLEKELGVLLVEKNSRDFRLTPAGEVFLSESRKVLAAVDELNLQMKEEIQKKRETIHIAFPLSLCDDLMMDMQLKLADRFPDVECVISNIPARDVANELTKGTLDLGVLCKAELNHAMESEFFRSIEFSAFMAQSHRLAHHETLTPEMFQGEKILVLGLDRSVSIEVKEYFDRHGVEVEWGNAGYVLPHFLPYLAAHGKGIAFAADHIKRSQMFYEFTPDSFSVKKVDPAMKIDLFMAWHVGKLFTPRKKAVLNFIIKEFGDASPKRKC